MKKNNSGFTLVELLVVIVILGILATSALMVFAGRDEQARHNVDLANLRALNESTTIYEQTGGDYAPFTDYRYTDEMLMGILVNAGYIKHPVKAATKNAKILWDFWSETWVLSQSDPGAPASPLGSTYVEIIQGMIRAMIKYADENNGDYGLDWGDRRFTDIGLDPDDWENTFYNHMEYTPVGSRLEIEPENGYKLSVYDVSGEQKELGPGWNLVYNLKDKKWYYREIAPGNEININTLQIVKTTP